MRSLLITALLLTPTVAHAQSTPPEAAADVAKEVDKGVTAYNAGDIKYYQSSLLDSAVYIADDGATFVGKERVVGLFTRIFAGQPAPQLAVSDVATGVKGDVAWARFKWTRTKGPDSRKGVATAIFAREGAAWRVVQIQNTPDGHGSAHH